VGRRKHKFTHIRQVAPSHNLSSLFSFRDIDARKHNFRWKWDSKAKLLSPKYRHICRKFIPRRKLLNFSTVAAADGRNSGNVLRKSVLQIITARRNARIASAVLATAIPSVCLSVRLSVRLSVTRRYCVKTTARSTLQFALSDSKMCLVL